MYAYLPTSPILEYAYLMPIDLTDPQFHPDNNPDVLDYLDNKAGHATISIYILKSGRLAIMSQMADLIDIRDDAPSLKELRDYSIESEQSHLKFRAAGFLFGEPTIKQWMNDRRAVRRQERRQERLATIRHNVPQSERGIDL